MHPFQTEGVYTVSLSAWNPIDGWVSTVPTFFEIIETIGPIEIDDFGIVTDRVSKIHYQTASFVTEKNFFSGNQGETKRFDISLEFAGAKTCLVVNYGDGSDLDFYGSVDSCRIRYPDVLAEDVLFFDTNAKLVEATHTYA